MTKYLKKIFEIAVQFFQLCREIFLYFLTVNGALKAGALAYATLVSIVPLVVLSFGILAVFPSFSSYLRIFHEFVFRHFIPSSAQVIQDYAEGFAANAKNLSVGGLFFFLLTAVLLVFTIESVFNVIWRVKTRRKGLPAFLMYWAILTLLPLVGGGAFALSIYINSFPLISSIMHFVSFFIPFLLDWVAFLFLFRSMPNAKVDFRAAITGSLIAALLFESMKFMFRLYIEFFSPNSIIYGVLGAIPIFLMWLYLLWLVIIVGAIITYKIGASHKQV